MKKIIILLMLFAIPLLAQTNPDQPTPLQPSQKLDNRGFADSYDAFRFVGVDADGNPVLGFGSSSNFYAAWDTTTGTTVDTLVFGFTAISVTIINDATTLDTLMISNSVSFPATSTIYRLGGEGFTKAWSIDTLYIKSGANADASKAFRIEAN